MKKYKQIVSAIMLVVFIFFATSCSDSVLSEDDANGKVSEFLDSISNLKIFEDESTSSGELSDITNNLLEDDSDAISSDLNEIFTDNAINQINEAKERYKKTLSSINHSSNNNEEKANE